jgi:CRISPR-associated Cas5-like protein
MLDGEVLRVKVTGDFACFTRPDLKVERMTYPCMTPSAARGILDCILWKPEFQWYLQRILVLKPLKFFSIKRNEIETMFDSYKTFLGADLMYMQNRHVLEGWLFVNFLSMLGYYKLYDRLRKADRIPPCRHAARYYQIKHESGSIAQGAGAFISGGIAVAGVLISLIPFVQTAPYE